MQASAVDDTVAILAGIAPRYEEPREGGLQDVGGVHRALGAAGADEGVDFVEEEDHVLDALRLLDELLEAFLELAAVLRAGDDAGHVEGDDAAVAHALGDVADGDGLGKALDDGGLADAGLADEDGVVLRAAAEDLDDALEFGLASDDGIKLALAREGGEVAPERVEGGRLVLALLALLARREGILGHVVARSGLAVLIVRWGGLLVGVWRAGAGGDEFLGREVVSIEDLRADGLALAQHGEYHVFGADKLAGKVRGLDLGEFQDLLRPSGEGDVAHDAHGLAAPDHRFELEAELVGVEVEPFETAARLAGGNGEDRAEDVLGPDIGVVEVAGKWLN